MSPGISIEIDAIVAIRSPQSTSRAMIDEVPQAMDRSRHASWT